MRLPKYADLSEEQDRVFLQAPLDKPVLVSGPPGTGKTVVAWYRAQTLSAMPKQRVTLLMYNAVLRRFACSGQEPQFDVKTMDSWFPEWWNELQLPPSVSAAGRVQLAVPKADRDEAKALGVRAHYNGNFQYWWIASEQYAQDSALYERWKPAAVLPRGIERDAPSDDEVIWLQCPYSEKDEVKKLGGKWDPETKRWYIKQVDEQVTMEDLAQWKPEPGPAPGNATMKGSSSRSPGYEPIQFDLVVQAIASGMAQARNHQAGWGHLIIDEAQDFPPECFEALRFARELGPRTGNGQPADWGITVFADENQRLSETRNSSLSDIRRKTGIDEKHLYRLSRNYRNTSPIAKLAQHFYVGLSTGVPDLPSRKGSKPVLLRCASRQAQIDAIVAHYQRYDDQEIGVIAPNSKSVEWLVNGLQQALDKKVVQTYISGNATYGDARKLEFDTPGRITVINLNSAKGLEFDAVFLPDLHLHRVDNVNRDSFRMAMFVMVSRARTYLTLMLESGGAAPSEVERMLPSPDQGLLEVKQSG